MVEMTMSSGPGGVLLVLCLRGAIFGCGLVLFVLFCLFLFRLSLQQSRARLFAGVWAQGHE